MRSMTRPFTIVFVLVGLFDDVPRLSTSRLFRGTRRDSRFCLLLSRATRRRYRLPWTVISPFSLRNSLTLIMPSDLYPTSTTTTLSETCSTLPLTTSPSGILVLYASSSFSYSAGRNEVFLGYVPSFNEALSVVGSTITWFGSSSNFTIYRRARVPPKKGFWMGSRLLGRADLQAVILLYLIGLCQVWISFGCAS